MKYVKIDQEVSQSSFLKHPTKGAISSSFFGALCQILSTFYQLQLGKKIVSSSDKIYQ